MTWTTRTDESNRRASAVAKLTAVSPDWVPSTANRIRVNIGDHLLLVFHRFNNVSCMLTVPDSTSERSSRQKYVNGLGRSPEGSDAVGRRSPEVAPEETAQEAQVRPTIATQGALRTGSPDLLGLLLSKWPEMSAVRPVVERQVRPLDAADPLATAWPWRPGGQFPLSRPQVLGAEPLPGSGDEVGRAASGQPGKHS